MTHRTALLGAALLGASLLLAPSAGAGTADASCPSGVVALTFDDGSSYFRPQTLQVLRDKRAPATFFDVGSRVAANPQLSVFAVREGHTVFNHTYRHDNLRDVSAADVRYELLATERVFAEAGVRMPFKGMREPFGDGDDESRKVIADLGYVNIGFDHGGFDFIPGTPAPVIREYVLSGLAPDAIIVMHDGPIDTTAGATVVEALPEIIDGVRARGYCFGSFDRKGKVVPDRLEPSGQPIPGIAGPVPYKPNATPLLPPQQPPGPSAVVSGLPVRYLSVELSDLGPAVAAPLARDIEARLRAAQTAQVRGLVPEQRARLEAIARMLKTANGKQLSPSARQRLLTLNARLLRSLEPGA